MLKPIQAMFLPPQTLWMEFNHIGIAMTARTKELPKSKEQKSKYSTTHPRKRIGGSENQRWQNRFCFTVWWACIRHSCAVQCLTSMFALLRAKRGGPYPFRITLFCFWKSQFQSTFSLLFLSAVWPNVTFGLAAVASIKPLQQYASWWSPRSISWVTQTGCPAAPNMNIIRGLCIGGVVMRQWCFFSVMCLRDTSHHRQSLNYPEPTDQNALGVLASIFL